MRGHARLAHHLASGLVADEFDMSFFQDRGLDHGCFSPLPMLWPHEPDWPGAIIPLQVGVLQFPIPSARRWYKMGQPLRKAIENYPEDRSVVIVGTGGLSHQVHGERDPFTLGISVKAYRLNKFLHGLIEPDRRQRFLSEEEVTFEEAQLTSQKRDMVRRRDWRAMIQYGVIFFLLEKLGALVGVSNLHIYAAMRGETLEEFQKTRNAQIMYSVAGKDKQQLKWEKPPEAETDGRR